MRVFLLGSLLSLVLPAQARAEEVMVFAAASLNDALTEAGQAFQAESGHAVRFSFGASSDLARQIKLGAPADVFFSADLAKMDELERAGLVKSADRRTLLSNQLVVIASAGSALQVASARDLVAVKRLALADPELVPAGIYARKWLEAEGVWAQVKPNVIPTLDVRAARSAVETRAADAAVVYKTDAAGAAKVRIALEVPREKGPAITYPVARLAGTKKAAAGQWVEFLAGPKAKALFEKHGFIVLPGERGR
jgi:molybdate transport system substrate-binding protein